MPLINGGKDGVAAYDRQMTGEGPRETSAPQIAEGDRLYLDTNVYNRLADELTRGRVRGLTSALAAQGTPPPLLSPVNVIEIVQTRDVPLVELKTKIGGRRIVQMPYGRELPRIC